MELYLIISFALGLTVGIGTFYTGFKLGFKVKDKVINDLPLDEERSDYDQEVTD